MTRHKENPFIHNMLIPLKGKQVRLSRLGGENNILINQTTGEVHGTHVVTYKKVDNDQFVKLFTKNIALTFNLKSAGVKTLNTLLWGVQNKAIGSDQLDLDNLTFTEFREDHKDNLSVKQFSLATFKRGLLELEESGIIAKTLRPGRYFINPDFCFNGDRVAFTTVIQKQTST